MTTNRKIVRWLLAVCIGIGSLPAALAAVDFYFGLCAQLLVPIFASAVWLTVSAAEERRPWWFGFSITVGALLPFCPVVERWLSNLAISVQQLSQRGVISISQRLIEPVLIITETIGPPIIAVLLAAGVGAGLQRAVRSRSVLAANDSLALHWRFSLREMLVALAAVAFISTWITVHTCHWQNLDTTKQIAFLKRFKSSFASMEIELLGEPRIEELTRTRMLEYGPLTFRPPGVNEYRIAAPIRTNGRDTWAVWCYTCNEGAYDMIYMFAHAEAPSQSTLPKFPLPAQRYVDITSAMLNGIPATAGPKAIVTSITSPTRADDDITLTASAPPGTVCELHVFPRDLDPELPPKTPNAQGTISWSWAVPASMAKGIISYEVRCIEPRGSGKMVSTTRGSISIDRSDQGK